MGWYGAPFWVRLPHILTGAGTVTQLGDLVKHLGGSKVLIVTDLGVVQAGLVEKVKQPLDKAGIASSVFDQCQANCPVCVIQSCAEITKKDDYDLLIGLGGGSTMDTVKVSSYTATKDKISLKSISQYITDGLPGKGLPKILIATTAGTGAEISTVAVVVDTDNVKKAVRSEYCLADIAIVDPEMTQYLPPEITASTGMDALTHAFESYFCTNPNILSDTLCEMSIKLISENLRRAYFQGAKNLDARFNMAVAATYAMAAPFMSGSNLYHSMGHSLQIEAKTTHGISLYLVMKPIIEFNLMSTPHRFANVAELLGENINGLSLRDAAHKAVDAVVQLGMDIGLLQKLRDIGVEKAQISRFVNILFTANAARVGSGAASRPVSREDATRIYESIW